MANVNGITKKIHFIWIVDNSLNKKEVAAVVNGLTRMAEKIKSLTGIDYDIKNIPANYSGAGTTIRSYTFLSGELKKAADNQIAIFVLNKRVYGRGTSQLFGHQNTDRFTNKNPARATVILNLDLIRRNSRNENDIEKLVYWFGIHEVGHVFGIAGKHEYRIKNETAAYDKKTGEHCVVPVCNMVSERNYGKAADFAIKNSRAKRIHCKWCLAEWKAYPNILDKLGK